MIKELYEPLMEQFLMKNESISFIKVTSDLIEEFELAKKAILDQERIYKDATELLRLSAEITNLRKILGYISN